MHHEHITYRAQLLSATPVALGLMIVGLGAAPLTARAQTASLPPTVSAITFAPASINSGGTSQMTIALGNANAGPATLTAPFVDTLPPAMTVAGTGASTSCGGAVSAGAGSRAVSLPTEATIPSGGCTITVGVTGTSSNGSTLYANAIPAGALQTNLGANPAGANATLTVQSAVVVPNVAGLAQSTASAQLTAAGFVVAIVQQYSASVAVGSVIGTQPAAGTSQARESTIRLIVSQGPGTAAATPLSGIPGLTPEQVSAARGLERTCAALAGAYTSGSTLTAQQQDLLNKCSAIIGDYANGANVPQLQAALNAISGRQATATARVPMQFAAGQIGNIADRLASLRGGAQGLSFSGLDLGAPGASQAALEPLLGVARGLFGGALGGGAGDDPGGLLSDRLGIFVTGTLRRGSEATTDAESGFNFRNTGLTIGADYRLGNSYVMGVAGGFGRTTTGFDDDGGRLDAKHTSATLYGSYFKDHFHIDWLASAGHNAYGLTRELEYQSTSLSVGCNGVTCSTETSGTTTAHQYTLSSSAGGDFNAGAFAFGPTLEVEYKQVGVNGFSEGGPSGLDLAFGGMTTTSLLSKAGAYLSYAIKTPWAVILPQARVRYMHEFMNDQRTQSVQFAADTLPGAADRAFLVYTDSPDRDYIDWRASVSFQFPHGIAGFVDYGGTAGLQNMSVHELNIGLRIEH